jgi:hypothetical protein
MKKKSEKKPSYLEDVNIAPFRPPNVEQATKRGITQDMTPSVRSANV